MLLKHSGESKVDSKANMVMLSGNPPTDLKNLRLVETSVEEW